MGDMISGLQQGVGEGQMDLAKLMSMMQGAMTQMMKDSTASSPPASSTGPVVDANVAKPSS
jgi:hypothetical protein